jgi:TolB-like protein/Flp pilus assembly protein TadD
VTLAAGTKLGSYQIVAPLGSGGMGEVYRARDAKLDRDVAIKVLPQHLTADADALARFEREAKAVASLSHPNILAIHDFGTQDGVVYTVTELLEGETLRGKLDGASIAQSQAVDWALQIAKGLSAAHGKGVVHRDLKPENVFVTKDGHVKILDFGLAKRAEQPDEQTNAPTSGHTAPGMVMGTVGYMSPEQVRGLPVDHRSDIFSFGAILYELLSGRKAFRKDTAGDTMAAIIRDEPPELYQSGRNIPVALDHLVKHCLEKDRDNRFQSAKDVVYALSEASSSSTAAVTSGSYVIPQRRRGKTLAIAAVAIVILAAAGLLLWKRPRGGATASAAGVKRIAVLPFENLGAPADDYFADGIADEVRGKLTSLKGVEVIARGSSTPYKKTTKTPQEIAKELDARYLLTATVRWQKGGAADRVQVRPELVEIKESGAPASRWQQSFDASLTDVFQVQSDIAARVGEALGVALAETQEKSHADKPTANVAAYDAFLRGEDASALMTRNDPPSLRRALAFYEQAVALDPSFALAWARIGSANALLYTNSVPTPELAERSRQAAEKAIALAPDRAEGHQAMAMMYRSQGDPEHALHEYQRALELAPGRPDLIRGSAFVEEAMGRWDEALEHHRQATRLDPRIPGFGLGDALLRFRKTAEARDELERLLSLAPQNLAIVEHLTMTYLCEGDLKGAREALARSGKNVEPTALVAYLGTYQDLVWVLDTSQLELLRRLTPSAFDDDAATWALVQAQASHLAGDAAAARGFGERSVAAMAEQIKAAPNDAQLHSLNGWALAFTGRKEEAIAECRKAADLRPPERDGINGPYFLHLLARTYTLAGEKEKAIDTLEALVKLHYWVSPGWLRIEPNFDPLRSNPRFQKLVAGAK